MKKGLKITGVILLLVVGFLAAAPYIFKDKIVEAIKEAANENLNAKMEFADVDLSLFKNFPNLSVNLEDLSLVGIEEFEGIELVKVGDLYAQVDLMSLFGDQMSVEAVRLKDAHVHVLVSEDGKANYDIAKESEEVEESESSEESAFAIEVQEYSLKNTNIIYEDLSLPMRAEIMNLNHEGKGDLSADKTVLETNTTVESFDLLYEGMRYVKQAGLRIKADLDMDLANSVFTFKENEFQINDLILNADGSVAMQEEDINFDIDFGTNQNEFKSLLSMVPASFAKDLNGVDVSGLMDVAGYFKGTMNETSMPGFAVDVDVEKGRFAYPDLPKSVESINIDLHVESEGGASYDDMAIDMPRCYMEIAENPIDITLKLQNAMIDPEIDCDVRASVVLDYLKDAIPLEKGDALEGSLNAEVAMHGKLSSIENGNYDEFDASGQMIVQDILFKSDSMSFDMNILVGYFNVSPQFLEVSQFKAEIGHSDLQAKGKINNYLAYLLKDDIIEGDFNIQSNTMDLNELMAEDEEVTVEESNEEETEMAAIGIPGNIDFSLAASFNEMVYGDIELSNVSGAIQLVDSKAIMKAVKMNVLEGQVTMDGTYDSNDIDKPTMDFIMDIKGMDIKQSAEKFYTIDKMAPIAKSCTGNFSTRMDIKADLTPNMEPIEQSIAGNGTLSTNQVYIEKFKPLNELAQKLSIDRLSKQTIEDVNLSYFIEDGKAVVKPFKIKMDGMDATIDGSTTLFNQEIEYNMKMDVPFEKLPQGVTGQASNLINQINDNLGSNISAGTKIPISVKLTGTIDNPKVDTNYGEAISTGAQDIKEEVIEEIKEEVEELIEDTKEDALEAAQAEADKIMADAQKEADKLLTDAKKSADQIKDAAYKEANNLENSGGNFMEKAANKVAADAMREAADKAHKKSMDKAQDQADKILANAQKKADEKLDAAQ